MPLFSINSKPCKIYEFIKIKIFIGDEIRVSDKYTTFNDDGSVTWCRFYKTFFLFVTKDPSSVFVHFKTFLPGQCYGTFYSHNI